MTIANFFWVFAILGVSVADDTEQLLMKRASHRALDLETNQLSSIATQVEENSFKYYLNGIMIPRVPGTATHDQVRDFISNELKQLGWNVTLDRFRAKVPKPFETLTFENIIATPNSNAERYLVVAAHYDSKWFADNPNFVAATDSAVSCAMLLQIAKILGSHVKNLSNDLGIMLVFFDGEEAIREWTATDSIYGARHLAKKWSNENFLPRIDMLLLLDLIGAADPKFYNYFRDTNQWYGKLLDIEQKLGSGRLLSQLWQKPNTYFQPLSFQAFIEDDHTPFLRRGVPVLHSIVYPFPSVWHKPSDDASAIDYQSVYDLTKVFTVFVFEYLNLDAGQQTDGVTFY